MVLYRYILTVMIFTFNLFGNAFGAVWEESQNWSVHFEEEYSRWMKSPKVKEVMFTNISSPYYGINPDCADAAYALRAIFSYENKLPFAITAPSGSRSGRPLNNRQSTWDHAGSSSEKRLIAMIKEIGESVGTENLAYFDTFPTAIKTISPGTLFMYKIKTRFKNFIRHSYTIKGINPVGTFDVIYSTQASQRAHLPLIRKKEIELENMPHAPWGFKKFRWPSHLGRDLSVIPVELGPSNEQFVLAEKLGEKEFFKFVKQTVATTNETLGQQLDRSLVAICQEAIARIDYVNQALIFLAANNYRCMNYTEFDAYSTPSRDTGLKLLYTKLQERYHEAEVAGELETARPETVVFSYFILTGQGSTTEELLAFCPINYRKNISTDLATLLKRIEKGHLSSHPNDIVELRWGEKTSPKTKCKRWY